MEAESFFERVERYKKMAAQNKRRSELGVRLNIWEDEYSSFSSADSRYSSARSSDCLGGEKLTRSDRWKLLRRSKNFLARRSVDVECFDSLTPFFRRKHADWRDKGFPLLDYFSGLKYSYSAPLPVRVISQRRGDDVVSGRVGYFDLSFDAGSSAKKARVSDLVRSRSIRLDPVDSPKQMFLYRLRIQRCIAWGYSLGFVPVMMTLTLFHRWHPLKGLLNVLSKAWNYFFTGTRMATRRAEKIGLVAYIRRAEETINNKSRRDDGSCGYNSGWHPHYHVILFVPRDKVSVLSSMEDEFRDAWVQAVNRYFELEFGEKIPSSYESSFRRHGLFFSRCFDSHNVQSNELVDDKPEVRPPLRHVDDSEYVAKIFGCEANTLYSGDSELTSTGVKGSIIPFDLLCEDTAENNDLWVEYALATKGVKSFFFSRGLERKVQLYFEMFPDRDPVKPLEKKDNVVAQISRDAYHFLYRSFKVDEMLRVATKGYEAVREWCYQVYIDSGMSADDITEDMLPQPPGSHSWVIGERRRHLTNLVDVLTNSQTQTEHDELSLAIQQDHAWGAQPELEEPRVNDNVRHIDEAVDVSMTLNGTDKPKSYLSKMRRVVYQPSLFDFVPDRHKSGLDKVTPIELVDLVEPPEPAEKISPRKPVVRVEPRRSILDIVDDLVASVDLEGLGCADFGEYLKLWQSNSDSAKSCREFLQSQPQEVIDFRVLLNSLPLMTQPSSPPPSTPLPDSPPPSPPSEPEFEPQSPSPFTSMSTSASLSSSQQLSDLSTPLSESSPHSSDYVECREFCDGDEVSDCSYPSETGMSFPDLAVDGLYIGDYLPQDVLLSPCGVLRKFLSYMESMGQLVDLDMISFLVNDIISGSVSALELIDRVRLGVDESDLLVDESSSNRLSSFGLSSLVSRSSYLDEESDSSFSAQYEKISKSDWYPEWYRVQMETLAKASAKATEKGVTEFDIDEMIFKPNDSV